MAYHFVGGLVTKVDYRPESFLKKERYNKDQLEYMKTKTIIETDLGYLRTGQREIKVMLKELKR